LAHRFARRGIETVTRRETDADDRADFLHFRAGTAFAPSKVVRLDSFPRAALILLTVGTCAVRVHSHPADMPSAVQEVNSCLRMVRVAASRRGRTTAPVRTATRAIGAMTAA
jgi:hypothetical protein